MSSVLSPVKKPPAPPPEPERPGVATIRPTPLLPEPTARLASLVFIFAAGCLAALALGTPTLAAVVGPLGVWLLWGVTAERHGTCDVTLSLDRERAAEGELLQLTILVQGAVTFQRVLCELALPSGLEPETPPARVAIAPSRSGDGSATLIVRCTRWGVYQVGTCGVVATNMLGLFQSRGTSRSLAELRVYPASPHLRAGVTPAKTQVYVGEEQARERAVGLEFADIRKFQAGDLTRRINWAVTAHQGEPYVNLQYPDHNADIVLVIDSFSDLSFGIDGTLAWEGRAASALAHHHLDRRDRVGLIVYGGVMTSLQPAAGDKQRYRILDTLINTEVVSSYERPTMQVLPPRSLPARALVVVFSPLNDRRMLHLLLDLHSRGYDLAVVEVDPERFTTRVDEATEGISRRMWRLSRLARRRELGRSGIPVILWDTAEPLDAALVQLNEMRHGQWRVRA